MKKKTLDSGESGRRKRRGGRAAVSLLRSLIVIAIVGAAAAAWYFWDNSRFTENIYSVSSDKISQKVRIVMLSDLHEKEFGAGNRDLIDRIQKLKPDLIAINGDMMNKKNTDDSVVLNLCRELKKTAPVFYSLGNHENEVVFGSDLIFSDMEAKDNKSGDITQFVINDSFLKAVEETGAVLLMNDQREIEVNGNWIDIGGISTNLSSMWPYSGDFIMNFTTQNTDHFKLLLCHRPEVVQTYLGDIPIDLCLSGHTHGGAVRVPGFGGLFANEQGFLPDYDAGMYSFNQTELLIGRGLGGTPRILNRPELVIVDLN